MTDVEQTPMETAVDLTGAKKGPKRSYDTFHTFIARLLHSEDNASINHVAKDLVNDLIMEFSARLTQFTVELVQFSGQKTITSAAFRTAALLEFGRENPAVAFADSVLDTFKNSKVTGNNSEKAGLTLPPARFKTTIEKYSHSDQNIGGNAHIYLTALVEYVSRQILKMSLVETLAEKKRTIDGIHLQSALGHSSLATYMNVVGPLYLVPNGLYTNRDTRAVLQKDLYKRIKKTQRKSRNNKKSKTEAETPVVVA